MEFYIERNGSIPYKLQLKEQIKLALGHLKPGQLLPSIRELEQQLDIGQAHVKSAYKELRDCGILTSIPRRGFLINRFLSLNVGHKLIRDCNLLCESVLKRTRQLGVNSSSFAKMLLNRAIEMDKSLPSHHLVTLTRLIGEDLAAQVGKLWDISIPVLTLDELRQMSLEQRSQIRRALTTFYLYDQVRNSLKNDRIKIIPIRIKLKSGVVEKISSLPSDLHVLVVFYRAEFPRPGKNWLVEFANLFREKNIRFSGWVYRDQPGLRRVITSPKYKLILISPFLWTELPEAFKQQRKVALVSFDIDIALLEEARLEFGVIV